MFAAWKAQFDRDMKKLRWKYRILRIKWILLFVLPILIVIVAYQTAKQYLKIRIRNLGKGSPNH